MLSRGIKLFRIYGFEVRIDDSWIILAILVIWSLSLGFFPFYYKNLSAKTYWLMGFAGTVGLFASIIFHEFWHSFVARKLGIPIRGITLFVFGGVAEMEDEPVNAKSEFYMAVIGPVSSILLGFIFYLFALWAKNYDAAGPLYGVLSYLKWINWVLAGFNLVPAFPLDGGRVLRSILWRWKGNLRLATRISSFIGSGFGLLLVLFGITMIFAGNFLAGIWYFLIGMFLRGASAMSYQRILIRRAFEGEKVRHFMKPDIITVPPSISITEFVEDYIYKYHYKMFPVVADSQLLGCVSTEELKQVPRQEWSRRKVQDILKQCSVDNAVSADTDAMNALTIMNKTGRSRLLVLEGNKLIGMISLRDLLKFFSLKLDLEGTDL